MAAARQYEIKVSMTEVATTMRTRSETEAPGWNGDGIEEERINRQCWVESSAPISVSKSIPLRTSTKRSEEHTSELQSLAYLVCRLLLEKKKTVSACVDRALPLTTRSEFLQ